MPLWIAGAAVLGSVLTSQGNKRTNQTNMDVATANNAFNAQEAAENREFQSLEADKNRQFQTASIEQMQDYSTNMSNTSYQRATKDMQAAGLNPMLAYSQGGASTPTGASASGSMPSGSQAQSAGLPHITNPYANVATAAQLAGVKESLARTDKIEAETENIRGEKIDGDKPATTYSTREKQARSELLHYQAKKEIEQIYLTKDQQELVRQQVKNAVDTGANIRADTRDTNANAVLRELARYEAQNQARHQINYPDYAINVRPFVGDATGVANSASGIYRGLKMRDWRH